LFSYLLIGGRVLISPKDRFLAMVGDLKSVSGASIVLTIDFFPAGEMNFLEVSL
jgi:hypothetical protein